jgi:hypothetical protein
MTPCALTYSRQGFRQTCCLHLQSNPRTLRGVGNGYYVRKRQARYAYTFFNTGSTRSWGTNLTHRTLKPGGKGPSTHWRGDAVDTRAALYPANEIPPSVVHPAAGNQLLMTEISKLSLARPHGLRDTSLSCVIIKSYTYAPALEISNCRNRMTQCDREGSTQQYVQHPIRPTILASNNN